MVAVRTPFRLASALLNIVAVVLLLGQGMPESTFIMRVGVGVLIAAVLQVGYETGSTAREEGVEA
ncbi:hypothetical protein [Halosegnis longus]|uniref:Uncharacterized protein n=1 Tax=Halosegnis longus TaxID=2216012 RepID=A0AAJ4UWN2_9EURY|nr:hypothetical protein Nmn1133_10525 [Salella cibi]